MRRIKGVILWTCLIAIHYPSFCQDTREKMWVDSVFSSLTAEQRIAQLFIIRAYSDRDSIYNDSIGRMIRQWNPGGVCFFKGTPFRQVLLTNRWQNMAVTPLLIAIDAENGLGMRLDSAFSFAKSMTLGATGNDTLVYRMASAIARDCKRTGIQINFAPVIDINSNPLNPVIHMRSFGENKFLVAKMGLAYLRGMQENGIMATAKHFPGHGDTDTDSHLSLPVIRHTPGRLDSTELYPFRELIRHHVGGVMTAHLFIPAFDSSENTAATLSPGIVTKLLRKDLGFQGYSVTDALDMKGVTKYFKPGEIELRAFQAGNDILLLPQNIEKAVEGIKRAADSAVVSQEMIEKECKKILELKYRSGLSHRKTISTENLYQDLNPESSAVLNRVIYKNAITLVRNENNMIPLSFLDRRKIAVLCIGDSTLKVFQNSCAVYAPVERVNLLLRFTEQEKEKLVSELDKQDVIIIGMSYSSLQPEKKFLIPDKILAFIDSLSTVKKVILDLFGSPYGLSLFREPRSFEAIVISYQDVPASCEASAEIIFGGIPSKGKLPVTGSPFFPCGTGIETSASRLSEVMPEEAGISPLKLRIIDSLALSGISRKAYPGCQVLFAKDGKIFYRKSFGNPAYGDSVPVTNDDLYDLASLTKVAATTLAVMKLVETGKISLDEKLGSYLQEVRGSNKEKLTIREIMAHQAGLQPWIPFYKETLKNGKPDPSVYSGMEDIDHPVRVAERLYIRKGWKDTIYMRITKSALLSTRNYKYSDLGFYYLRRVVEKVSGETLDQFVARNFYRPLGLKTMGYKPLERFPKQRIIPTENDTFFRHQLLRGDVHDMGAAMLGGISGHAGLFSDAYDLAVIMQMLINHGEYGGKQYLLPSTIKEFTREQFPQNNNRRGLGFDRPLHNYSDDGPVCKGASQQSFGHSGFTGTYIWADPENKLVYVFLSNRINPYSSNEKLVELNFRTKIHEAMYEILKVKGEE